MNVRVLQTFNLPSAKRQASGWDLTQKSSCWGLPLIFTSRKLSLGQGNVFIGVCHSFRPRGGGGWLPSMHHRSHDWWGLHPEGPHGGWGCWADPPETHEILWVTVNKRGGTHPTGMHSC